MFCVSLSLPLPCSLSLKNKFFLIKKKKKENTRPEGLATLRAVRGPVTLLCRNVRVQSFRPQPESPGDSCAAGVEGSRGQRPRPWQTHPEKGQAVPRGLLWEFGEVIVLIGTDPSWEHSRYIMRISVLTGSLPVLSCHTRGQCKLLLQFSTPSVLRDARL